LHVVVVHLDVRLGEEAEDLRQQIAFLVGELGGPVLHVLAERHFLGDPVHLLLAAPEFIRPGIAERLVAQRWRSQSRQLAPVFASHPHRLLNATLSRYSDPWLQGPQFIALSVPSRLSERLPGRPTMERFSPKASPGRGEEL